MRFFTTKPDTIPSPSDALPGRPGAIMKPGIHRVLGTPIAGPWPEGTKTAVFGLGCFWGDEKDYWQLPGVVTTATDGDLKRFVTVIERLAREFHAAAEAFEVVVADRHRPEFTQPLARADAPGSADSTPAR